MGQPGVDYIGVTTPFYCHDGQGKFVMHKRSKNCRDEIGTWDFGGGQVEFGETLEQCVFREVREEYGCKGEITGCIPAHDIFRVQNGIKTHWLVVPFFVLVDPKHIRINEPHKVDDLDWFTLDAFPSPLHSGVQMTLAKYRNLFEEQIPHADKMA